LKIVALETKVDLRYISPRSPILKKLKTKYDLKNNEMLLLANKNLTIFRGLAVISSHLHVLLPEKQKDTNLESFEVITFAYLSHRGLPKKVKVVLNDIKRATELRVSKKRTRLTK